MAPALVGLVQGSISAATYAATEKIAYGRNPSITDTLIVGVTSGVMAGGTQFIGQKLGIIQCFIEGTLVAAKTGLVPIEDIQPGDLVWATDEETGETALKEVVQIFRNETEEWVHIKVNGEEITCTPMHPFYSPVKGWTSAVDLRAGDILVMLNGEYVVVEQVQHELLESPETTYNFEVEDYHTYYIGSRSILSHNKCSNPGGRHGGEAHRSKVASIKNDLTQKGWNVSVNESRVNVGGSKYRYPDVVATKGGVTRYYQVGKATKAGIPIARELRALKDLGRVIGAKTYFVRYN